MRNLSFETAIWDLFTSTEFFESAAAESEEIMNWFGILATSRNVVNFGRNNQIFDEFKRLAHDFRRGAALARLGDYQLVWRTARSVAGSVRGMMEQPLHSWMTEMEYKEFSNVRISRLMTYTAQIERALINALVGAESFFNADPNYRQRNKDAGFPGDEIVEVYNSYLNWHNGPLFWRLPDPLPEYMIDRSLACHTGEEVPYTGVWFPETGLERHSLAFAIKGLRMQPAFRVVKTVKELESENDGVLVYSPETVAVATIWHPVIASGRQAGGNKELRAKAGESCPRAGVWQPMDASAAQQRTYEIGETMANLGSAYGITVWHWVADR